jgi:hypothetical protein
MKKKTWFVIMCLSLFAVTALTAQMTKQTGAIRGVVTDNEGLPCPGCRSLRRAPR